MNEAREKFEALLMVRGSSKPEWDGKKYTNRNVQSYWRWFYMGWTVRGEK